VSDLSRSVEFFKQVFGSSPTKQRSDYAKFELSNPAITLSLEPIDPREQGVLNHVGFKLQSGEELVELQRRLEMAGIRSEREEGVECCYSKQTKFWLHDPDGTLWEMYVLEGDLEHRGAGQSEEAILQHRQTGTDDPETMPITCSTDPRQQSTEHWSHRLGQPLEIPDQFEASSLDEIQLQGSFNAAGNESQIADFLSQVSEKLKSGGRLGIHCLTANRPLDQVPELPGPASVVKSTPCLESLLQALETAGFSAIRLTKYGRRACFTAGDAELRETMIEARKAESNQQAVPVVYTGPFAELKLDDGTVLSRGKRTPVSLAQWNLLQSTPAGETLVMMETAPESVSCTS